MTALARPWCRSATVPSAWAVECTTPSPFWKAMAPIIELMQHGAPRLEVVGVGHGPGQVLAAPRRRPSRAMPSQIGL